MAQRLKRNWLVSSKWHEEFDEFLPDPSKISKIYTLMGFFWKKVYNVRAKKKYSGVMFDGSEYWCNIWKKHDFCFQKWHEEFSKFSPEHVHKSKNWAFDRALLFKVENAWA